MHYVMKSSEHIYKPTFPSPRHLLEVSGQLHILAALSPEKEAPVPIG
jgi:hypothetical protein